MLNLIIGRSGYGKSSKVNNLIKNHLLSADTQLVLLVPEQASFETEKEMLNLVSAKNLKHIDVLSFTRLCEKFFELYGGRNKRCIDMTGRTALMELSLKSMSPHLNLFKKQTSNPQFIKSLLKFTEQMKRFNVDSEHLMEFSTTGHGILKQKLYELSLILSDFQSRINKEYYDPLDDLKLMGEMLNKNNFFKNKIVFIDSFKGFTSAQLLVIEKIIILADEVYISLGYDGFTGLSGNMPLFSNVASTARTLKDIAKKNGVKIKPDVILSQNHRFQNEDLAHLENNIFSPEYRVYTEETQNVTVCEAKNIYEEADYIARTIRKLIRTENRRYRDFAVIARDLSRYNGIINTAFERYQIPCFIDERNSVETMAIFKFVIFGMQAVINRYDTEDIISMLKTGLTELKQDEISLLDNYSTIWKINGSDWEDVWTGNPIGFSEQFSDEEKLQLEQINQLREYVLNSLKVLKTAVNSKSSKEISAAIYNFVTKVKAPSQLTVLSNDLQSKGFVQQAESERRSYDIFVNLIEQLVLALDKYQVDFKKYFELISSAISLTDIGSLPQGIDEVMIGAAERIRPKSPKVAFIIGANEGIFPAITTFSGVLTDNELEKLDQNGITLPYYNERSAVDEMYLAYSSLSCASEKIYITYAATDMEGNALEPSVIVTQLLDIFEKCKIEDNNINEIEKIESVDTALSILAREFKQQTVMASTINYYFEQTDNFKYDALMKAANLKEFSLSNDKAMQLFGKDIYLSASKIDVFFKCRFYYFCKYGIKANPLKVAQVDVLQRGTLVHYILEQLINGFTIKELADINNQKLFDLVMKLSMDYLAVISKGKKFSSQEQFNINQIVNVLVKVIERVVQELTISEFEVYQTELEIGGDGGDVTAMELIQEDGNKIFLTGKIDRVDIFKKDGKKYVRILDYKTGSKAMELTDVLYGQNLQMLVYMMALQKDKSKKFGSEIIPAGILYMPAKSAVISGNPLMDDEEINKEVLKSLKFKGVILNDTEVIEAMEPGCVGLFTSVKINKNGSVSKTSPVYTLEQFGKLTKHIEKLLIKMAGYLHSGDISVNPLDGVNTGACDYCDYRTVCKRDYSLETPKLIKIKNEEVFEALEDGENSGV